MTAMTAPVARTADTAGTAARLRAVLVADGAVTAAVGVAVVAAAPALAAELPGSPTVVRVLGVLLLLVGADVALAARSRDRLPLVGVVVGELAIAWAVGSTAVTLLAGAGAGVTAAVLAVAAASVAFGVAELVLSARLRRRAGAEAVLA